jgi:hypothetical protein
MRGGVVDITWEVWKRWTDEARREAIADAKERAQRAQAEVDRLEAYMRIVREVESAA